jgi:hypothetical protein
VPAVAADAVCVAHHLQKLSAHLVTAPGPPTCAQSRAKKQPIGGKHAGEKQAGGSGETQRTP